MEYLGWVGLVLGVVSRIFVPWLNVRRQNPEEATWSWRYVWPQLIAVLIAILLLPLMVADIENIGDMAFAAAYITGWGAADIGRFLDKAFIK